MGPVKWIPQIFEIMCGRYTVAKDQETLSLYFGAEFSETHLPIFKRYGFDHWEDRAQVAANSLSRIRNSNCESRRL